MHGQIGGLLMAAARGDRAAGRQVSEIFGTGFLTPSGWHAMLDHMPLQDVETLLARGGAWWTRECFQALYVACWIHHPVEKGSFMMQLRPSEYANVKDAYQRLLASGAITSRISSHLGGQGASAHEGWAFLKGYEELLVQVEGERAGTPYLFLKCEGHALTGFGLGTILHGAAWVKKELTGSGATASPALNKLARNSHTVEARAAENFSTSYGKLVKKLKLSGKVTTIDQVVQALLEKVGLPLSLPDPIRKDTHSLGRAMLGPTGYIALFHRQREVLRKKKVPFDAAVEADLKEVAERMVATAVAHPTQHFNEVRVTPLEVQRSLAAFRKLTG
jgi:hypothetical protein